MYRDLASPLVLSPACTTALRVATTNVQRFLNWRLEIKKLEKKCKPSISHHKAWLRSVSRLSRTKKLAHGMDYMEIEEVVNEGRQSNETEELNLDVDTKVIAKDKGSGEKGGSTVSTARPEVDTARPDIDTAKPEVHTANAPVSTAGVTISTMKEEKAKEKGVAFKDVEDSSRPIRSITTLKLLPSIDPKDKGNGILVEEEPEEKEEYTIEEKAKFLAETIAAQRKFRAAQRDAEIRSRPPTKSQLRNLMMTYLKNMGSYKYSQLKARSYGVIKPGDAENCGVHTLTLEDGTEIYMLVERKYPLIKETLERMMSLKLIAESASDGAYDLLRFIQKQIDEAGSHDGGG
ncbi:hypothetical protein Tco_0412321 [Tanacetum coccineum]